jgi:uncharacterized protein YndB with AHSA1/START domain
MTSLRIDRTVPAATARVWHALTDAAALTAWFWPARLYPQATVDADGFTLAGEGLAVRCRYLERTGPHRLRFSWQWDGEDLRTEVTIDLSGVDGAEGPDGVAGVDGGVTELALRHDGFPGDEDRAAHIVGWTECLDRLPPYLAERR